MEFRLIRLASRETVMSNFWHQISSLQTCGH